jgi:hypothetical protein
MKHMLIGAVVALVLTGCHKQVPPPQLSPVGVIAWENGHYQPYMDTARDLAISIPQVPAPVAKPIVVWHRSAITVLHARSDKWKDVIIAGLGETVRNLPATTDPRSGQALEAARLVLMYVLREEPITDASVIAAYEAMYTGSISRDDQWLATH